MEFEISVSLTLNALTKTNESSYSKEPKSIENEFRIK